MSNIIQMACFEDFTVQWSPAVPAQSHWFPETILPKHGSQLNWMQSDVESHAENK